MSETKTYKTTAKQREVSKLNYQKNKEKARLYQIEYRKKNSDKIRLSKSKYKAKDKAKWDAYHKNYYIKNKAKISTQRKAKRDAKKQAKSQILENMKIKKLVLDQLLKSV